MQESQVTPWQASDMDMDHVSVVVLDGEELHDCLTEHRLVNQFGSSLLKDQETTTSG